MTGKRTRRALQAQATSQNVSKSHTQSLRKGPTITSSGSIACDFTAERQDRALLEEADEDQVEDLKLHAGEPFAAGWDHEQSVREGRDGTRSWRIDLCTYTSIHR
jgi:hypothetical protein